MKGFDVWQFLAGVAVFLFASNIMDEALKNLAGRSFKKFLQKQSQNKFKMAAASTVATAVLQSSSVVTLIVLSFVGAGLINLQGALASVLGANLGTTLDSWIIAIVGFKINLKEFSYPLLAFALPGLLIFRDKPKILYFTRFIIGFALIFIALEWLKGSVSHYFQDNVGGLKGMHYIYFIPAGFIFTAIVQSSSVTMAIALSALYSGLIPFENAAAIVIGSELGTTLKFLVGSVGGISDKKRVAWGNTIINFITMCVAAILLPWMGSLIQNVMGITDKLIALVVFQTGINLISFLVFFPLLGFFVIFLEKIISEKKGDVILKFIDEPSKGTGHALSLSQKEILNFANEAINLNKNVFDISRVKKDFWENMAALFTVTPGFDETYKNLKTLQGEIFEYISEMPKSEMSEEEEERANKQVDIIRHLMRSVKNLKDIRHNLTDFKTSANDTLFNLNETIKQEAKEFYSRLQFEFVDKGKILSEKVNELNAFNRRNYDRLLDNLQTLLKEEKITELDSSNLINAYREIYSSNKALLRALSDLYEIN